MLLWGPCSLSVICIPSTLYSASAICAAIWQAGVPWRPHFTHPETVSARIPVADTWQSWDTALRSQHPLGSWCCFSMWPSVLLWSGWVRVRCCESGCSCGGRSPVGSGTQGSPYSDQKGERESGRRRQDSRCTCPLWVPRVPSPASLCCVTERCRHWAGDGEHVTRVAVVGWGALTTRGDNREPHSAPRVSRPQQASPARSRGGVPRGRCKHTRLPEAEALNGHNATSTSFCR